MTYTDNPVGTLHSCVAHAVYQGFPEITYEDRDWAEYHKTKVDKRITKTRLHSEYDLIIHAMFPQTWGSTALGFGGIGGAAMTTAYVVVIESHQGAGFCVYFGGRFAYRITKPTDRFFADIQRQRMEDVAHAKAAYEGAE